MIEAPINSSRRILDCGENMDFRALTFNQFQG